MNDAADAADLENLLSHRPFVRRVARALVRDAAAADDLEQEVWLRASARRPRRAGAVRAWLGALLRNAARDRWRAEAARARREERSARPEGGGDSTGVVAEGEALRLVVDAVMELPEPYRETVLLRYWRDRPPREIARSMGVPVETVRTRLRRALDRLRQRLDADQNGDRAAWLVALAPLAGRIAPAVVLVPAAAVLLAAALVFVAVSGGPSDRAAPASPDAEQESAPRLADAPAPRESGPEGAGAPAVSGHVLTGTVLHPDGSPGAGVTVRAGDPERTWAEPARSGRADATGAFRIAGLAAGRYALRVSPSPGVRVEAGTVAVPGASGIVLTVPGGATFRGRVVDVDTDRPLGGAEVRIRLVTSISSGHRLGEARAVTRKDGAIRLEDLPPGVAIVEGIRKDGYLEDVVSPNATFVLAAGVTAEGTFRLRRASALYGRVAGPDGAPVSGAKVSFVREHGEGVASTKADAGGAWRIGGLGPCRGSLMAWVPGLELPERLDVEVPVSSELRLDLVLQPVEAGTVEGTVVDTADRPAGGARVGGGSYGAFVWTRAREDGAFSLAGFRAGEELTISARRARSRGTSEPFSLPGGGRTTGVRIVLVPPGEGGVAGRVTGPGGELPHGTTVRLVPADFDARDPRALRRLPARPDPVGPAADGVFTIEQAAPGEYRVLALADGCIPALSDLVTVEAGEIVSEVSVELAPRRRLAGVVIDDAGRPVPGARIGLGDPTVRALADDSGRFELSVPVLGPIVVTATTDGCLAAREKVAADETEVILTVVRGHFLAGRCVDVRTGKPAGAVPVRVVVQGTVCIVSPDAVTDSNGAFAITGLPDGTLTLQAAVWPAGESPTDWMPTVLEDVAPDRDDLVVRLTRGLSIAGRVVDEAGRPVRRAVKLFLRRSPPDGGDAPEGPLRRSTRADGTFDLSGLGDGTYAIRALPPTELGEDGGAWLPGDVENVAPGTTDLAIALRRGDVIHGAVVDAAGRPVVAEGRIVVLGEVSFGSREPGDLVPDHRFTTRILDPDRTYDVVAFRFPEGRTAVVRGVRPGDEEVSIRLRPGREIAGRVVDESGRPAGEGVPVWLLALKPDGRPSPLVTAETETGPGGAFRITGLPDLPWRIEAGDARVPHPDPVPAGATDVRVVLRSAR